MSRSLRTAVLAASTGAAILALAACTPTGDSTASPKPTTSSSASASASASPTGSPSSPSSSGPTAAPVTLSCSKLVSAQTVYDYNPNFVLIQKPSIPAGSAAAQAQADKGVACAWQNTTSNAFIYVSAVRYPSAKIAELSAAAGAATSAFAADSGYYAGSTASAVEGDAWIVATSTEFLEAGDAKVFIDSAAGALG